MFTWGFMMLSQTFYFKFSSRLRHGRVLAGNDHCFRNLQPLYIRSGNWNQRVSQNFYCALSEYRLLMFTLSLGISHFSLKSSKFKSCSSTWIMQCDLGNDDDGRSCMAKIMKFLNEVSASIHSLWLHRVRGNFMNKR